MLLRGVPDAIKTELAQFAKEDGKSLSQKAVDILRKGLAAEKVDRERPKGSAWEMLRSAFETAGPITGEFAAIMDEIEAESKRDFGRPVDLDDDEIQSR